MLQLFRNNSPFTVIILFIFALLAKFQVLLHPAIPLPVPGHYMYNFLLQGVSAVLGAGAFAYTMLAVVLLFFQALYLKSITTRHKLFPKYTYVPAFVFLLLSSLYPSFSFFSETLVLNWFLMGAVDVMLGFTNASQSRKLIFNSAFLFSVAAIFQCTMLAFFFLLLVGMVMFRAFNLGEWSVSLMGYITPFYFLVCILFLIDQFYMVRLWLHPGAIISFPFSFSRIKAVTVSGILLVLGAGLYAMRRTVAMSNIYIRRDWIALSFYLIISFIVALLTCGADNSAWLIALPALSVIVSHALLLEKTKWFSNFIFYFSLVFLVFCLVANK